MQVRDSDRVHLRANNDSSGIPSTASDAHTSRDTRDAAFCDELTVSSKDRRCFIRCQNSGSGVFSPPLFLPLYLRRAFVQYCESAFQRGDNDVIGLSRLRTFIVTL